MHNIRIEQHLICVGFRKREKYCIKEVDECYDYSWRSSTRCAMRKAQYTPYPKIQPKTSSWVWQFQGLDNLPTRLSQPCHNHATTLFQPCHHLVARLLQGCYKLATMLSIHGIKMAVLPCEKVVFFSIWEAARKVIGASQVIIKAWTDKTWIPSMDMLYSEHLIEHQQMEWGYLRKPLAPIFDHKTCWLSQNAIAWMTSLLLKAVWNFLWYTLSTSWRKGQKNMLHHVH